MTTYRRPHEHRVIDEKTQLTTKTHALAEYISSPLFARIDEAEQVRMKLQLQHMVSYAEVLGDRIDAFPPMTDAEQPNKPRDNDKVTELNPELAGQPIFKNEVPIGATAIEDVGTFAMLVDHWHSECVENGNRLLQIPEGTRIELEDEAKPGELIVMHLDGPYLQVFRVGLMTALNVFKDLPFGASIEEAGDPDAEG